MSSPTPVAVITGCSAGIGRAAAARFLAEGWIVHNLSRRPSGVAQVIDHAVDLSDLTAIDAVAAQVRAALPSDAPVCLVHNAGVMETDRIDDLDPRVFDRVMRINVTAPALLSARLIPAMAPGSSVLYIGSTLSEQGVEGRVSYVTSKHAIIGLMRATTQDLFGRGIHTVAVCPGLVDTEMVRPTFDASAEFRAFIASKISTGRLIEPAEMAAVIWQAATTPVLNGSVLHAHMGQRAT